MPGSSKPTRSDDGGRAGNDDVPLDDLVRAVTRDRLDKPVHAIVAILAGMRPDVARPLIQRSVEDYRATLSKDALRRGAKRSAHSRNVARSPSGVQYTRGGATARPAAVPDGVEIADDWVAPESTPAVRGVVRSDSRSRRWEWVHFGLASPTPDDRLRFLFQAATAGAPTIRLDLDDSGPQPVISRFEILAAQDSRAGVTSDVVRALPVGKFLAAARAHAENSRAIGGNEVAAAELRRRLDRLRGKESAGRGRPDSFYRRIALEYLEQLGAGVTRGIHRRIAELESMFDEHGNPESAKVRDAVNTCAERGFLTRGQKGRAGRGPGPRLFDVEE